MSYSDRLNRNFVTTLLLAAATGACGLSNNSDGVEDVSSSDGDDGQAEAGGSSQQDQTPPTKLKPGWVLGSPLESVISAPVQDSEGNIYVIVGSRDEARLVATQQPIINSDRALTGARMVSLEANGKERWRSEPICDTSIRLEEFAAIAYDSGKLYAVCGEAVALDDAGKVQWRTAGYYGHGIAITRDGTVIARKSQRELVYGAIDSNGASLWEAISGVKVSTSNITIETVTTSPIVAGDSIYIPCDACDGRNAGVATVDEATGATKQVLSFAGTPTTYGSLAGNNQGSVALLWNDVYLTSGGVQSQFAAGTGEHGIVLFDASGPVFVSGKHTSVQLMRGAKKVADLSAGPNGRPKAPVALLEDGVVLLDSGTALNEKGQIVFEVNDAALARHSVVASGGQLVYVTTSLQLVSVAIPVAGLDQSAPWPTIAGRANGSHRAD